MSISILLFIILFLIWFQFVFFKGTIFELSLSKGNYSGMLFFLVPIIYIYPAVILINIFPINEFWVSFKVLQENVFSTSLLVLLSYLFMLICIFLIVKIGSKSYKYSYPYLNPAMYPRYRLFVYYTISISLISIFILWLIFDLNHALLGALATGDSTSIFRSELRNDSIGRYFSFFTIITLPLTVVILSSAVFDGTKFRRFGILLVIAFIASFGGHKGPTAELFIIFSISYATFHRIRISMKTALSVVMVLTFILLVVYKLASIQYHELSNISLFWDFFWQRVFVAQLIGTYEEFSLYISNSSYILNGVPFLNFIKEVPNFSKDLLLISEDRIDPLTIGVKNTFIIAELYAIGGWFFIPIGILIYVINYLLSFRLFLFLFNRIFRDCAVFNKFLISQFIFYTFNVTGAFTDLVFFKLTIMCLILMMPLFLFPIFLKFYLFMKG
jgi:hypothetical protein